MSYDHTLRRYCPLKALQALFLTFLLIALPKQSLAQGLQFYGNEKRIEERSSYRVINDEHSIPNCSLFELSFDYEAQNIESPGYIFYLKDGRSDIAYNLNYYYDPSKNQGCFTFARDGQQIYHSFRFPVSKLRHKRLAITLTLDATHNKAHLCVGDSKVTIEHLNLAKQHFFPQLYFGMYHHILETASFVLRDLHIAYDNKTFWDFPLNESHGEEVHDSRGDVVGHVSQPIWYINKSYYWESICNYYSSTPSGFAYSAQTQRGYIYNRDSIICYRFDTGQSTGDSWSNTTPYPIRLGMNFFDENRHSIYAYELNGDESYMSVIDPVARQWRIKGQEHPQLQMHHHCGIYLPADSLFVCFGGYGNRRYYKHFISYDLATCHWDTLAFTGAPIQPRFFASTALSADGKQAYIYGGKGNEAGEQSIGIQYYYDLYRLNLEKRHITKLWEQKSPDTNRVPTRDMLLSADGKYLYLLAYAEYKPQTNLQLYRLSIADGTMEAVADSLSMRSEEIATNANLYLDAISGKLYCVIQEFEKDGASTTRIYSLTGRPVSKQDIKYYDRLGQSGNHFPANWIATALFVLAAGTCSAFLLIRKKRWKSTALPTAMPTPTTTLETKSDTKEAPHTPKQAIFGTVRANSLLLFGSFHATDKNGRDITYMFSPKIKHLFLYILIHSIDEEGVQSTDLNSLFWPDKSDEKIKNLKNVTISHLRKTLQEIEGIKLVHDKGVFRLQLSEPCYCDYQHFRQHTQGLQQFPTTESEAKQLYAILSRGKLLNTIQSELFDYAKQQSETYTIRLLTCYIQTCYQNGKDKCTLHLCNLLLDIDPFSEIALNYTVCTLKRANKHDKAMLEYASFCKEYRKAMNEDYPVPFQEISTESANP